MVLYLLLCINFGNNCAFTETVLYSSDGILVRQILLTAHI